MTTPPFDPAAAERRLGRPAVEAIARDVAQAPPLQPAQRAQLRVLFDSVGATRVGIKAAA